MTLTPMSSSDADLLAALTERQVVALTVYGEARGERVEGKVAVACVIRNRVNENRFGVGFKAVCLAPWQFSCWKREGGAANHDAIMTTARLMAAGKAAGAQLGPRLRECDWIAEGIIGDRLQDITRKATHYITRQLWETKPPKWAMDQTPCIGIGAHVFFNGVP